MEIHFATKNPGKVHSLKRDLGKYGIDVLQEPIELIEPRSREVQEIAKSKIEQAYHVIGNPTIVIDAGFYIDSLKGFPRAFVNFSLKTIGLEGILRLAEGKSRRCEFRECLAYMDRGLEEPEYFISHVRGNLSKGKRGEMQKHLWSELGLIFIPKGSDKTLAEMPYDEFMEWRKLSREKDSVSQKLYLWLSKYRIKE